MTWKDLSVFQFQQFSELWKQPQEFEAETINLLAETCEICFNISPQQLDSLSIADFNALCKELTFLNELPDWKPVRFVVVDGRRYRFIYDVRKIHAARNIEIKQYGQDGLIPNLHKLAASMVVPQRRNWLGQWRDAPYDATEHETYANDMRDAPITSIYGSALFFCKVFSKWIVTTADYLTSSMPKEMKTEATQLLQTSAQFMAGSTTPAASQSMKGSRSTRHGTSRTSSS